MGDEAALYSLDWPHLVSVLYEAVIAVAHTRGWDVAGGHVPERPKDYSGRDVPG